MHPQVVIFVLGPFARMTCCKKCHERFFTALGSNKKNVGQDVGKCLSGSLAKTGRTARENDRPRPRAAPVAIVMTKRDSQVARGCSPWLLPLPAIRGCSPWLLHGYSLAIPWPPSGATLRRYPPWLPSVATLCGYPPSLPSVATVRGYPRGYPVALMGD